LTACSGQIQFRCSTTVERLIFAHCAGSFTGVAEGTFYAANLKNAKTVNANDTLCASRCRFHSMVLGASFAVKTSFIKAAAVYVLRRTHTCSNSTTM